MPACVHSSSVRPVAHVLTGAARAVVGLVPPVGPKIHPRLACDVVVVVAIVVPVVIAVALVPVAIAVVVVVPAAVSVVAGQHLQLQWDCNELHEQGETGHGRPLSSGDCPISTPHRTAERPRTGSVQWQFCEATTTSNGTTP